jgi:hypothetical protein
MNENEILRRFKDLEEKIEADEKAVKPILDAWAASKILTKLSIVIGGLIAAIASVIDYTVRHWKP